MKDIVVLYHKNCLDGLGGAYAAWKKFGDSADYIGMERDQALPPDLAGKELYLIDYSFPKETMLELEKKAKRMVVLDHHVGVKDAIESVKEHVFDNDRSGSGIAWNYFHPDVPLPKLLAYVQEIDLWRFALPNSKEVGAYLGTVNLDFETYDTLLPQFEDDKKLADIVERGKAYSEYAEYLCGQIIETAEEVEFEGYTVLAVNSGRALHSLLGNMLAKKHPPFSIVWYRYRGMWNFSLRGDGSIDLTKIAQKYGGNGHHNAAGFRLPFSSPMPFTFKK
jgi:oligoribonuclease NrnB/cAMP/cGMP phosphodiesterase (DHH superfamily)